jgi:O-antigen ligase
VFALPGIGLLIVFILARPQEFLPLLQKVPFLHLGAALAAIGYIVDLRLHRLQPIATNTLPWVGGFLIWALISTALNAPEAIPRLGVELFILFVLYGTIAHGVQRFRTFQFVAGILAVTCVFIAAVCFHQGLSGTQCVGGQAVEGGVDGKPDGRLCETHLQCSLSSEAEPGLSYRCEKVGLFDTYTIEGRVRYMGELHDPNEVGLLMCAGGIGLLIGFAIRKKKGGSQILVGLGVALILATILMTQSRGALVAAMLVPGVYLVRRYGARAVIPAALLALPVLALGGRGGASADESTMNRYEAWAAGIDMFKHSPFYGVGARMFTDHHYLAAHNSYVLTMAELGLPGMFMFITLVYLSIRTLLRGLKLLATIPGTEGPQVWGMALLSGMGGITFQINTLSFAYHSVLWLFFGLTGAWYSCVRHHKPDFEVKMKLGDLLLVGTITVVYAFIALPLWLKYKGVM